VSVSPSTCSGPELAEWRVSCPEYIHQDIDYSNPSRPPLPTGRQALQKGGAVFLRPTKELWRTSSAECKFKKAIEKNVLVRNR
jgi:hypothetical protein